VKPYLHDPDFTLWHGNVTEVAWHLPNTIQTVVTSPPYYGLRDYGTGTWENDPGDCNHASARIRTRYDYSLENSPIQDGSRSGTDAEAGMWKRQCPTCKAVRIDSQIGQEERLSDYIDNLVYAFGMLRPALKPDATMFVNIGDGYSNGELMGVPWMFAHAMKDDGWRLINDVIWVKPNGMPESAKRRFTKMHEHIFVFAKSANYKFNQQFENQFIDRHVTWVQKGENSLQARAGERWPNPEGRNMRDWWAIPPASYPDAHFAVFPEEIPRRCIAAGTDEGDVVLDPFMGSGTTARVARKMGRTCIGIELNETYCKQIADNTQQQSLFAIEEDA
jgi:DNA modification methylase